MRWGALKFDVSYDSVSPFQTAFIVKRGFKSIDGERDNTGKHWSAAVDKRHNDRLPLKVIILMIIAGKRDQRTKTQTQREEDLCGRIDPSLRIG